jgi:hypothetical protein
MGQHWMKLVPPHHGVGVQHGLRGLRLEPPAAVDGRRAERVRPRGGGPRRRRRGRVAGARQPLHLGASTGGLLTGFTTKCTVASLELTKSSETRNVTASYPCHSAPGVYVSVPMRGRPEPTGGSTSTMEKVPCSGGFTTWKTREPRAVAVQVDPFESKGLKPRNHFIDSRVETTALSSYGSAGFNLYSPAGLSLYPPPPATPTSSLPRCSADTSLPI